MDLLTGLNRDLGITVLMVTHEPDMAAYARTIVHFRDGLVETVERSRGAGMSRTGRKPVPFLGAAA